MSMTMNISENLWLLLGFWFPFPDLFSLRGVPNVVMSMVTHAYLRPI